MIEFLKGDVLAANVEALVNTVNCVGIMGRGVALQFRKAFPDNYAVYRAVCARGDLKPGRLLVHEIDRLTFPRFIINFPTKVHWKGKSKLSYVESGLKALIDVVIEKNIGSIALPPLGSGLGGLNWGDVRSLIVTAFDKLPNVRVLVYEPVGAPVASEMVKEKRKPKMTAGRAALLGLVRRYLAGLMDTSVSLLEIHKLMYFMQEAGEDLRLRYEKGLYGPYAENLRHVISAIEGYYVSGYGDGEDAPSKQIELVRDSGLRAEELLRKNASTRERFDRVIGLINGFETPYGLELLATVHWLATKEGINDRDRMIEMTHEWNAHKKMFDSRNIMIAMETLRTKGWLPPDGGVAA
jgi:O-acetyl-ADP-ribose deacetylase (regulator of RNase III)